MAADNFIADVLVFALILTFVAFIIGFGIGNSPMALLEYWNEGFFANITFTFQLALLIVICATCAKSKQVERFLMTIANIPKTPTQAIVFIMVFGYLTGFINWCFCNVATPILAMHMCKKIKGLHWPMIVAGTFAAQTWSQCMAPGASVYALLNTEGHFMQDILGIIPANVTAYNPANVIIWFAGAIVTVLVLVLTTPGSSEMVELVHSSAQEAYELDQAMAEEHREAEDRKSNKEKQCVADLLNNDKIMLTLLGIICMVLVVKSVMDKGFLGSISLNFVIFLFFGLNCFIYKSPRRLIEAYKPNMVLCCEITIIYFLYSALATLMQGSGIAAMIVAALTDHATAETLPVITYWVASFINLFVPSQGGQWLVQGPIAIETAQQLGADIPLIVNAFVYGDQATNLLQPLYAVPLLAVANMKLKECWGTMAFLWIFWLIVTSLGLYFVPMFI